MRNFFRLLFLFSFLCVLSVAVFHEHEGYVLFILPPYRIEISFLFFLLSTITFFFVCHLFLRLLGFLGKLPQKIRRLRQKRKHDTGLKLFSEAFIYFLEGRYARAASAAARSFSADLVPVVSGLMAAQAYHALGQVQERDVWLDRVKQIPNGERAQRLTAAELYIDDNTPERAIGLLSPFAQSSGTRHLAVTRLLFRSHLMLSNWSEALRYFRSLEKRQSIHPVSFFSFKKELYQGVITQAQTANDVKHFFSSLSEEDRQAYIDLVVEKLISFSSFDMARRLIEEHHKKDWISSLALLYSKCGNDATDHQIECAELWLKQHPQDISLLICLGRLCRQRSLWGKAKEYFDRACSISHGEGLSLYEMASLLDHLGEHEKANMLYRRCVRKAFSML